jgi:hypothetical protein
MIKRWELIERGPGCGLELFRTGWAAQVKEVRDRAPADALPVRWAHCHVLEADVQPGRVDAVDIAWFRDPQHVQCFEDWVEGDDARKALAMVVPPGWSTTGRRLLTDERVLRHPDYVDARWSGSGPRERIKQMAMAKRREDLTLAEFSSRWSAQAGMLGAEEIPEYARGRAYIQNHALDLPGAEWPVDGVNELYFDDISELRRRQEYFASREKVASRSEQESFFSPTTRLFLTVREEVVVG